MVRKALPEEDSPNFNLYGTAIIIYLPKACLVWNKEGSCGDIVRKMSDDSESLSLYLSASGEWPFHWSDPEDAQVTPMCHRVATDTIP
jgi:hypothetical protein